MRIGPPEPGPYLGPRPFDFSDRDRFFGRDAEIQELLSLVVAHRVVLLYAPSGAGKTSLLNAGLIPVLVEDAKFDVLPIARVRGLADARAAANPYITNVLASLGDGLNADASTLAESLAARDRTVDSDGLAAPTALLFDQFEELFSLYPERWAERRSVFEQIADALEQDELLRLIIALREDFVAQLDPHAALVPGALRTRLRIDRLRPRAALSAVTRPAAAEGRTFAPGTAERLIEGLRRVRVHTGRGESAEVAGEFVEPVQLQVVCRSLWEELTPDVTEIRDEHVAAHGNVADVLARYYEEAVSAIVADEGVTDQTFRDRFEEAFITPVGTRGTVVAGEGDTAGIPLQVIDELERRHLLRAEWRAGARWFELTHDSLIAPIRAANAAARERARAGRERRLKALVGALGALAAALVGTAAWLVVRDTSPAPAPLGVILAEGPMKQLALKRTFVAGAPLISAWFTRGGHAVVAAGSDGRIRIWDVNAGTAVATLDYGDAGLSSIDSPRGGRSLLAAGALGARRWSTGGLGSEPPANVQIRLDRQSPVRDPGPVSALASDPTGQWVAVVRQGHAAVVNATGDTVMDRLFAKQVLRLVWSPRGPTIAAVAVDGTVEIVRWKGTPSVLARKQAERRVTLPAKVLMNAVAFSPDGRAVVTASSDGRARLWRVRDGKLLATYGDGRSPLVSATLSPDGRLVAMAARDGRVEVVSRSGQRIAEIRASHRPLAASSFAAAGRLLVTAGGDGRVRVWAVTTRVRPLPRTAYLAATEYYTRTPFRSASGALGVGGHRYAAAVTVSAPAGRPVRSPEPAVIVGLVRKTRVQLRELMLRDTTGRVWVFSGVDPATQLVVGERVPAGARIATVPSQAGGASTFIGIQLLQHESTGRLLSNFWNPELFLDFGAEHAVVPYPGDDAPPGEIARWMGTVARAAGLPPELPVMAALVESGLRNVQYGDRDLVGFFQMSRGIWDQGAYAGFPKKPDIQLRWFVDVARGVRADHISQGEQAFGADPSTYGKWVADVEQPPAQYRSRFQLRLHEARQLLRASSVGP